jgi:hypothetical protein
MKTITRVAALAITLGLLGGCASNGAYVTTGYSNPNYDSNYLTTGDYYPSSDAYYPDDYYNTYDDYYDPYTFGFAFGGYGYHHTNWYGGGGYHHSNWGGGGWGGGHHGFGGGHGGGHR